jgi:hypothetical protein
MAPSVIAIIKGGVGNQLFIYAAARALALRTGRALYLDTVRGYTNEGYGRRCRLSCFPIQAETMPEAWRIASNLRHPRHKIIRALNKLLPRNARAYLAERHHLPPTQLTALQPRPRRITLLGYWQDEGYFAAYAEAIRAELTPPAPADESNRALGEKLAASESVFIHFRRVRYWNLLGRDYYQGAIDAALARVPQARFALFGDDLEWPRQNLDFRGAPVEAVAQNGENELADLWLMRCCRHAVVANSSFSWWGAWLADDKRPRHVFAPAQVGWPIVIPERWQRIANVIEPGTGQPEASRAS